MGNSSMNNHNEHRRSTGTGVIGFIVRFAVATLVLLVTSYFVRGFVLRGLTSAIIAALVIAAADYLIEKLFKFDASPFGRGITGFIVSAAVLYFTQYLVPGMSVSLWGAVIGALVIGIIDAVLPTRFM